VFFEAIGTLKAEKRTEISSRLMAPIDKILVRAGQAVKAGELLIELDRRDLEARRRRAEAAAREAQAKLTLAESEFNRATALFKKRVVSQADLDLATANYQVAQDGVNLAKNEIEGIDVDLTYTRITAPRMGLIVDRLAEVGNMARPGFPLLVLYDPSTLRLEVPVMEKLVGPIKDGDKLQVRLDALGGRTVTATVDEKVPQAEAGSRSVLVRLALTREEGRVEGMFGRVQIPAGQRRFLCLAAAAVQRVGQLEFVDVAVLEKDGEKSIERRLIRTGRSGEPGRIEVLSGLEAGEEVVVPPPKDKK
jgi:membrane fusion protein, multidrug efflux system